jgi:hypothetical protein
LPAYFRLERASLQVDRDKAVQPPVVKQQINVEFLAADFETMLTADERESFSELQQ